MPSLSADLKLRPTRIGFLVRPSDLPNLRKVFQICSCLWGGMYNPIIPVSRSLPAAWRHGHNRGLSGHQLALGYIRFFEPDVFVETEPGLAQSVGIADDTQSELYPHVISLDDLVDRAGDGRPNFKFGLDIFNVYRELYHSEFKFVPRHDSFVALFRDRSRHGAYIDATFGGFPKHESLAYIQQGYKDAFDPAILKHEPSAWLQLFEKGGHTPLTFTDHALESLSYSERYPTIFVANPTSPLDLLDLWNLRLIRRNVLLVNSEWLPALRDYLRDFIAQNHRPLSGNPNGVMIHTTVEIGNSFSKEEAEHLARDTFADLPKGSWPLKPRYDPIWRHDDNDHVPHPRPVQIHAESSRLDLPVSEESRPSIQFQSLAPEFASEYGSGDARWVNVVSLTDFQNQHRLALALPSTATSPPYRHLRGAHSLFVSTEGFVLPQRYKHGREYMALLTGTEAVVDWFKRHDIDATASDAGRVADQILSSVGGVRRTSLLQDKGTLDLLNKMSKSTRRQGHDTIEEYPDRTAPAEEWKGLANRRGKKDFRLATYLDRFVEAGALKLGLSVPCPNCKKKNWYGLDDLAERVACERCLKGFSFPQGSLNYKNTPWEFRVAGPYSVPDYANGAYATVLALRCIACGLGPVDSAITFSTNLDLKVDSKPLEIDLACWFQRKDDMERRGEPVFLVGEAKSFAQNAFSKKDITRLKRVGQKMPGTFLVFATLKPELSTEERARIGRLATWGRLPDASGHSRNPVIVLTGTELFARHGISEAWKNAGGKRQSLVEPAYIWMDNLRTLADLTQQVYLELQPMSGWLLKYWKRRHERRSQRNTSADS